MEVALARSARASGKVSDDPETRAEETAPDEVEPSAAGPAADDPETRAEGNAPDEVETPATVPSDDDPVRPRRSGLGATPRLIIACALVAAIAVAGVLGVMITAGWVRSGGAASAEARTAATDTVQARREVQVAVESFVNNLNSYSVADIDSYKQRLMPTMTDGFGRSFSLAVDNLVTQVKATKMTSEGNVLRTAVSGIDSGNATALVVADANVESMLGERIRHFRWQVSLVKQDGRWLIDNFRPVG